MGNKLKLTIGLGGIVVGLLGIGYAVGTRKKLNDICSKLDKSIDELSDSVDVEVPQYLIDKAVNKAVERSVERGVRDASDAAVRAVKNDIHKEVSAAVTNAYSDISKDVTNKIAQEVSKINMKQLSDSVTLKAEQKIIDKFDGNLDELLDKFNRNLDNTGKIYESIANSLKKNDSGKEMTFKIS